MMIVRVLRRIMSIFPTPVLTALNDVIPGFFVILPNNRLILFKRYLGDCTVSVNTMYPIEREMLSGGYDRLTSKTVKDLVTDGDVCLDIGANIGAISLLLAAKAGPQGKVYCFEPGPVLFERLTRNISLNPRLEKRMAAIQLGLSDSEGVLYWNEHEENRGDANLTKTPRNASVKVGVTTIDSFFEKNPVPKIDFVKIDVESMEYEVIKGGRATWKKYRPILYYETLKAFETYRGFPVFRHIEQLLVEMGYQMFKVDDRGMAIPACYPDYSENTLAMPGEKVSRLKKS